MNKFGLSKNLTQQIIKIFSNYSSIDSVHIFGSRAIGNYRNNSDIDLVIYGNFDNEKIEHIKLDLEDIDTAYFFDVLDANNITSKELKEHIKLHGKIIYEKK